MSLPTRRPLLYPPRRATHCEHRARCVTHKDARLIFPTEEDAGLVLLLEDTGADR
jgi:hypothetical protein